MQTKRFPQGLKACIFDLDGTLVDSMGVWKHVDQQFFLSKGMEIPEDYQREISHMAFRQIAQYTVDRFQFKETPEELMDIWMGIARTEYAFHIKAKKNAKTLLSYLKERDVRIALATSNQESLYRPCLENNGLLPYFDLLEDANRLKTSKEEPTLYLDVARRLDVLPEQCLVFEDILVALKTAKKASFQTIAVQDDASQKDAEEIGRNALLVIDDFQQAIDFLEKNIFDSSVARA